jgi:flagellar capping protein FliD
VTDSAKLSTALSQNMSGTQNLLKGIGTAVHNLLSSYVGSGGSQGILTLRQNSVDTSIANYNATIQQRNDLIAKDSDQLRQQYYALQQQYLNAVQSLQEWTAFGGTASSSGVNLFG